MDFWSCFQFQDEKFHDYFLRFRLQAGKEMSKGRDFEPRELCLLLLEGMNDYTYVRVKQASNVEPMLLDPEECWAFFRRIAKLDELGACYPVHSHSKMEDIDVMEIKHPEKGIFLKPIDSFGEYAERTPPHFIWANHISSHEKWATKVIKMKWFFESLSIDFILFLGYICFVEMCSNAIDRLLRVLTMYDTKVRRANDVKQSASWEATQASKYFIYFALIPLHKFCLTYYRTPALVPS